jgi:prepilin-type N-terminal cleavage/methylation domain-containing protein
MYKRKHDNKAERVGTLEMLKTRKQQGFTIVELLIVIVVIGILAAIVITTFNGVQQTARNTERETDIKALHGQLEAYFAQNGRYPTLGNMNDATWRSDNLRGLDPEALSDPRDSTDPPQLVAAAATDRYAYAPAPTGCDNGGGGDCTEYVLTASLEGGTTYEKNSLN